MTVYLGADHRGFVLKEKVKDYLIKRGWPVIDLGNKQYDRNDDYPDFAALVGKKISQRPADRGILFCGSGVGVCLTANKFRGVLGATVAVPRQAKMARNDENVNVLCLAADLLSFSQAKGIVNIFLKTAFSRAARHQRRVRKIGKLEGR
jgi:ribose 5-phosphate isomerase B